MSSNTSTKAPVSSHPAFPAVIALWFGALFGLGSLALRAGLLENAVLALGIDLIVPAAAPPLGSTARLLVAVLLSCTGGLLGYGLARGLRAWSGGPAYGKRKTRGTGMARPMAGGPPVDSPSTLPEDDNDDLARLEAARDALPLRRRGGTGTGGLVARSETAAPPAAPPVETPASALPGRPGPMVLKIDELEAVEPLGERPPEFPAIAAGETTLEGTIFSAPVDSPAIEPAQPETVAPAPSLAPAAVQPTDRLVPRPGTAAQVLCEAPLRSLGMVELVERFAIALSERRARDLSAGEAAIAHAPLTSPGSAAARTAADDALALDARLPADPPVPPADSSAPFAAPNPPRTAWGRPFDMPDLLRPPMPDLLRSPMPGGTVEWFETADDAQLLATLLPPRRPGTAPLDAAPARSDGFAEANGTMRSPSADLPHAGPSDLDGEDGDASPTGEEREGYSSLLAMKPSLRSRWADPAAGSSSPPLARLTGDPLARPSDVTDDELRTKLAMLQRMTGTA